MTRIDKISQLHRKAEEKSAKRLRKKEELATAAIGVLKQLGYARTSLRDIAKASGLSVGSLHYYFEDKVDLIGFCVQRYKSAFLDEMGAILNGPAEGEVLARNLVRGLAHSILRNAETHRLWYDFRSQAMFDPAFREVVADIEDAVIEVVSRLLDRLGQTGADVMPAYFLLDGAFRYYLQRHLAGDSTAAATFEQAIADVLVRLAPTLPRQGACSLQAS